MTNDRPAGASDSSTVARTPIRFRYIPVGGHSWLYGVVQRINVTVASPWRIVCLDSGGFGGFDSDPWEALGHIIGDVSAFDWIENPHGWHDDL